MSALDDHPYLPLRNPEFRWLLAHRFLCMLGIQVQIIAVAWQVYSLTKDPLSLGLIGLAEIVPAIGFALFAGHVVDRTNRKLVLCSAVVLAAAVSLLLCLMTFGLESGAFPAVKAVATVYSLVFFSGIARAFYSPSHFAFFSEVVPKSQYIRASAWSSTSWQVAAAGGPALGGLLYGFGGPRAALVTALSLIASSLVCLVFVRARGRPVKVREESMRESLTAGLRFVFNQPVLLSALSLDLFAVLFGGAVALLPIFADILQVGPQGLGLMRAAPSVGASLMALVLAHRPPTKHAGRTLLAAVAGFGVCMILFGLSKSFGWTLFLLALSGALDNVSVLVRSTILQVLTPDDMRGRVSAVNSIFIGSSNEVGEFESGLTAKWMGTVPAVLFGGCMTILVVIVTAWKSPKIRRLNLSAVAKS